MIKFPVFWMSTVSAGVPERPNPASGRRAPRHRNLARGAREPPGRRGGVRAGGEVLLRRQLRDHGGQRGGAVLRVGLPGDDGGAVEGQSGVTRRGVPRRRRVPEPGAVCGGPPAMRVADSVG